MLPPHFRLTRGTLKVGSTRRYAPCTQYPETRHFAARPSLHLEGTKLLGPGVRARHPRAILRTNARVGTLRFTVAVQAALAIAEPFDPTRVIIHELYLATRDRVRMLLECRARRGSQRAHVRLDPVRAHHL
jgi:hypothetical protein